MKIFFSSILMLMLIPIASNAGNFSFKNMQCDQFGKPLLQVDRIQGITVLEYKKKSLMLKNESVSQFTSGSFERFYISFPFTESDSDLRSGDSDSLWGELEIIWNRDFSEIVSAVFKKTQINSRGYLDTYSQVLNCNLL